MVSRKLTAQTGSAGTSTPRPPLCSSSGPTTLFFLEPFLTYFSRISQLVQIIQYAPCYTLRTSGAHAYLMLIGALAIRCCDQFTSSGTAITSSFRTRTMRTSCRCHGFDSVDSSVDSSTVLSTVRCSVYSSFGCCSAITIPGAHGRRAAVAPGQSGRQTPSFRIIGQCGCTGRVRSVG